MGGIINTFAFPKTEISYNYSLPFLKFINTNYGNIPICHYHHNDTLNTMIYAHSNAQDIGHFNIELMSELFNANICLFDYSGYGLHGNPKSSELYCNFDIQNVYDYLIEFGVPTKNIILCGRSIGTGPVVYLAKKLNSFNIDTKIILISPFLSVVRTMINIPHCPGDVYNLEKMATYVTCPVLIIHGCRDKVCDINHSKYLSTLFQGLVKFVELHGCGHHQLHLRSEYYEEINDFING